MPTFTTNYGLSKPLVNNATDQDLWGGELNGDMDELDGLLQTAINWTPAIEALTFSVPAPTAASSSTGGAALVYYCDSTTGAIVASLPAASTCTGMKVAFKKTDVSANVTTITPNGTEKIDGAASYILSLQYQYVIVASDGTGWNILSAFSYTANLAPIDSPAFTGIPTAPTPVPGAGETEVSTFALSAKAIAKFTNASGLLGAPYNIASFVRTGAGLYTVTFLVPFFDQHYVPLIIIGGNTTGCATVGTQSGTSFSFEISSTGSSTPFDPSTMYLAVFGK